MLLSAASDGMNGGGEVKRKMNRQIESIRRKGRQWKDLSVGKEDKQTDIPYREEERLVREVWQKKKTTDR